MSAKTYTAWLYQPGSTDLSTGNVDLTFGGTRLAAVPTVRSPLIRPLDGRSEGSPWYVDITDVSSTVTANLADSSGRLDWMGRLLAIRRTVGASTATWLGVGRVVDVSLLEDVATWRLTLDDERTLERQARIFTTNTSMLYPAGRYAKYGPFAASPRGTITVNDVAVTISGKTAKNLMVFFDLQGPRPNQAMFDQINDDLLPDYRFNNTQVSTATGNFAHLRLRVGDTDYPVYSFWDGSTGSFPSLGDPVGGLRQFVAGDSPVLGVTIAATTTDLEPGQRYSSAFLHMMGAEPTNVTPLHIGPKSPRGMIEAVYTGSYSSSGTVLPRYSTSAVFGVSNGPGMRWRITGPEFMADWMEDHVYAVSGLVPAVDAQGRIAPRSVMHPMSTAGITYSLTKANLAAPHPTFEAVGREQITAVRFTYRHEAPAFNALLGSISPLSKLTVPDAAGADLIVTEERSVDFTNDRLAAVGRREKVINADGLHTYDARDPFATLPGALPALDGERVTDAAPAIARDYFARFGDGPIQGMVSGLSTMESLTIGENVLLTLGTYPNLNIAGRGGTRVIQVLQRIDEPAGPSFRYLDAGPNVQPVATSGITLTRSTVDPKHTLQLTVGTLTAGAQFTAQLAASSTKPSSGSTVWTAAYTTASTSTGVYDIGQRASNTTYWGRVRAIKASRVGSPWYYTTAGVATSAISPPSFTTVADDFDTRFVTKGWTNGDARYPSALFIDTSSGASWTTGNLYQRYPPRTNQGTIYGLTSGTTYYLALRHFDGFGGVSAVATTQVATSTSGATACPALGGLVLLTGLQQ